MFFRNFDAQMHFQMNLSRTLYIIRTYPNRLRHRHGYSVQSPWAYELVRDVFFEKLSYYAYQDLHLTTESQRQLWRIQNHFRGDAIVIDEDAPERYGEIADKATDDTVLVIEHIDDRNALLWDEILRDTRCTVTFDLVTRGVVTFDKKRIKQNYTL